MSKLFLICSSGIEDRNKLLEDQVSSDPFYRAKALPTVQEMKTGDIPILVLSA